MRRLVLGMLLVAGLSLLPVQSQAGVVLGSFRNETDGNDRPDDAVLQAYLAIGGTPEANDIVRLFKEDRDEGSDTQFPAHDAFSVAWGLPPGDGGTLALLGGFGPTFLMGSQEYEIKFVTVKIDGSNAGFNIVAWDGSSPLVFDGNFFLSPTNSDNYNGNPGWKLAEDDFDDWHDAGFTYTYETDQVGVYQTSAFATSQTNLGDASYDVSHISVWAVRVEDEIFSGPSVPEPSSIVLWGIALSAFGYGIQRRRRLSAVA